MNSRDSIWRNVDWQTIGLFLVIALFGWLNIYGAIYNYEQSSLFSLSNFAGKQLMWIGVSLVCGFVLLLIDERSYQVLGYLLYAAMIAVLIATAFVSKDIKGSHSWLTLGPLSIQPAEFAKCVTAIALAKYMSRYGYAVRSWRDLAVPFLLVALPMGIVMVLQNETGTALVFLSFVLMFYRRGMSGKLLFYGFIAAVLAVLTLRFAPIPDSWWDMLQPHHRDRIQVILGLKDDPAGVGYNVAQSLIAIGSGRFFGKGFLQGTQTSMNFVPEQHTDFIFSTVGEEWGFVGAAGLVVVYMFFILHLIRIAERQRDTFSEVYAYSVVGIFLCHFTINIGMVLGLLPVIGIPLPFVSYGGSQMLGFAILLFILLRLDANRVNKLL